MRVFTEVILFIVLTVGAICLGAVGDAYLRRTKEVKYETEVEACKSPECTDVAEYQSFKRR